MLVTMTYEQKQINVRKQTSVGLQTMNTALCAEQEFHTINTFNSLCTYLDQYTLRL